MLHEYLRLEGLKSPLSVGVFAVFAAQHHFTPDGDIVEPGALEPRVVLVLAVLAPYIAVRVDLLFMPVHHTAVEVVVQAVLLQDADECLKLELHAVAIFDCHDVVAQPRIAGKDVVGGKDAVALLLADADGLHHCPVQLASRLPVRQAELAHADDDQLVELRPVPDDVLSRVVHSALEGPVQPRVGLLLEMAEDWDAAVQLLVLLEVILLFELFGQALDDCMMLVVLELVENLSLVAEVAFDLPPQLVRHRVLLGHPS